MLKIDLAQVVQQINARRSRVRYSFQELALMLSDKLNDPKSKPLYMRLAKNEEQELIMQAYSYTIMSLDGGQNKGRFFMWKLKQLKIAEIEPISILLTPIEEKYKDIKPLKLGTIEAKERGNYSFVCAAMELIKEKYGDPLLLPLSKVESEDNPFAASGNSFKVEENLSFRLKNSFKTFFDGFKKSYEVKVYPFLFLPHSMSDNIDLVLKEQEKITIPFTLCCSSPILTNKTNKYRIPRS